MARELAHTGFRAEAFEPATAPASWEIPYVGGVETQQLVWVAWPDGR